MLYTFEFFTQIPDYLALDKLASSVGTILIVGGGFLGSELAAGLAHRGKALWPPLPPTPQKHSLYFCACIGIEIS